MATERNEYFMEIIDHLNKYNDRHGQRLSIKNLKEVVLRFMEEEEEEIVHNIDNITCNTSFQSPVAMNIKNKDADWSLKIRLLQAFLQKWLKISNDVLSNQQSVILHTEILTNKLKI